jgi:hypothetical protein
MAHEGASPEHARAFVLARINEGVTQALAQPFGQAEVTPAELKFTHQIQIRR